jgi:peroxiredoxin
MQLRDHEEEFSRQNAKIVVVTFEDRPSSRRYVEETALPWPLMIDETRELYRSYGMLPGSFWDIWGPRTWLAYLKEIIKGQKLRKSEADVMQRGGDVLIDPDGIVQMHHVAKGPAYRPRVETILQVIDGWHGEEKLNSKGKGHVIGREHDSSDTQNQ